jgi:cyanophycinase
VPVLTTSVFLHGGGRDPDPELWRSFVAAARRPDPRTAVVVLADDGPDEAFARWDSVLAAAGAGERRRVTVDERRPLHPTALVGVDAVLIAHGWTPGYAAALAPHAAALRTHLITHRLPVGGSSAGAAVLAERALVGGWQLAGRVVCPEEAGEDLVEVTLVPGLGLVPWTIDVHAGQWGTLARLVAAVDAGLVATGVALDEETLLEVVEGTATVAGSGHAWLVRPGHWQPLRAGDELRR